MFFQGERGKYIGFYALALTNGVSFIISPQLLDLQIIHYKRTH